MVCRHMGKVNMHKMNLFVVSDNSMYNQKIGSCKSSFYAIIVVVVNQLLSCV